LTEETTRYLDGDDFARALTSGIHRVLAEQELLNRINVFPVADSDTGTNLCLSLGPALGVLGQPQEKHLATLLAAVADTLLDSARGNSGAIIAQFFQGLSDAAEELTRFTTYTFARAVAQGNEYAHDALSQPRDGTILSVVAAFSDSIAYQVSEAPDDDFGSVLRNARASVDEAVERTPEQLDVLRKAGVVDAGARGFAELVAGFTETIIDGTVAPLPDTSLAHDIEPAVTFAEADNESHFRYCTECIVTGNDINRRKLREALAEIGDSLVLAGTKRKAKIHIHVDEPETVFDRARQFGELSAEKADDMHRQQHSTHDQHRRFAVITDSGADISDEDLERLDIHMVPCRIQFGNRGYLDKLTITCEEFYAELEENPHHPTTSQPAPGDFRRQFQFLASHFQDVISINLTSAASGTYQAARLGASRIDAPGRVHVIDSRNASMAQGQLVVLAAECAAAGLGVAETIAAVEAQVPLATSHALLSDLRYAVRGGRLPGWVKKLADMLHLLVIVRVKRGGSVGLGGFLFGRRKRIVRFAKHVARRAPKQAVEIGIGHAVCAEDAAMLEAELRARIPDIRKLTVRGLGPGLGVHGGPGTLLVGMRPWLSAQDIAGRLD